MVHTTTTRTGRPSLMSRLTGRHRRREHERREYGTTDRRHHREEDRRYPREKVHHTTGTNYSTAAPVHRQRRRTSIGDKVSGAMLKLKGSLTHRPGVKAAGTRRMRGTDGRGSHRVY